MPLGELLVYKTSAALSWHGCYVVLQVGGTLPGGIILRGLSGGERKRLSIAQGEHSRTVWQYTMAGSAQHSAA